MVKKMTQKERITRILGLDENDINYDSNIDTFSKRYRKVKTELAFDSKTHTELIFQWLYNKDTNLKSLTSKNRTKEEFEADLHEVLQLQRNYYETEIYPKVFEDACNRHRSWSDVDIILKEKEYQHSLLLSGSSSIISELDMVLSKLTEKNLELNHYIDKTLKLIFSDYYEDPIKVLNVRQFEEVVLESIEYYGVLKVNHKSTSVERIKNPYLALYQYMRKAYIRNYYDLLLPDSSYFSGCKDIGVNVEMKSVYGLRDVAFVISVLTTGMNTPSKKIVDKSYEKLKKSFQKYKHVQAYKVGKQYEFPNVIIPISHYFFGEENLVDSKKIMEYRIQPILQAFLKGDSERVKTAFLYINFLKEEFKEIMASNDHRYQITMIGLLLETIVNIFFRSMGLNRESVYAPYR